MLKTLVGDTSYARALDLYFDRHDGQACTIEDWLKVFEDVTGRDLSQFARWYSQAGTPHLSVTDSFADGTYTLELTQSTPPSSTTPDPQPLVIPVAVGLLGADGSEVMPTQVLELTKASQSFSFPGLADRPVPSVLRGFSAPVVLDHAADDAFLLAHDTDPFNRWEAGNKLARASLIATITKGMAPDEAWLSGIERAWGDNSLDPAYRSLMLDLPGQSQLAAELYRLGHTPDPDAIWNAVQGLKQALAERMADALPALYAAQQVQASYAPDARQSGMRALGNSALSLISRLDGGELAQQQYDSADNMTQQLSALAHLIRAGRGDAALSQFEAQWKDDRLVMDKWFSLQVSVAEPDNAADTAKALTTHPAFNWKNPNRFRATLGALAGHHAGFHARDGSGYTLLANWLIKLDPVNPQTTARMCAAFQTWRRYDAIRQSMISKELDRIAATPNLSRDTTEMITRIREA